MVSVVGERRVNLPGLKIRVLELNLVRPPIVGDHVQHKFNDLCGRALNNGYACFVNDNVFVSSSPYYNGLNYLTRKLPADCTRQKRNLTEVLSLFAALKWLIRFFTAFPAKLQIIIHRTTKGLPAFFERVPLKCDHIMRIEHLSIEDVPLLVELNCTFVSFVPHSSMTSSKARAPLAG
jgi:hypothetical protein